MSKFCIIPVRDCCRLATILEDAVAKAFPARYVRRVLSHP